jgi:hypothetical protein
VKKIFLYSLFFVPAMLFAQSSTQKETRKDKQKAAAEKVKKLQKDAEEGTIIFNKQLAFNIALNNDGYAFGFEKAKYKSILKSSLWWINFGERKHTKEEKVTVFKAGSGEQLGNPFVYGKQNNFYYLKIGFGQQRLLGGKNFKNGVAVQAIYGGGLSLGMLKPYYLEVKDRLVSGNSEMIKYSEDDARFLRSDSIFGSASFGKGFNEMKYVPGLFAKAAIRFDYGKFNDVVTALEIGIGAEFYTQKMPIMLLNKEKNLFINSYISLIFGSRK